MHLQSRKYDLIQALVKIQDIGLIEKLETAINSYKHEGSDWWDEISADNKDAIMEGIQQLDNGEGIPHEEARRRINEILGT
jgi:predicted transcriptional regulator